VKWLLLGLVALFVSVVAALVALPDPGYVLIGYGKYSVETSLLVFVVVLLLIYAALRVLAGLWHAPRRMHGWEHRRRDRLRRLRFDDATRALSEGRYERAERRLARLLKSGRAPLQVYLSAAEAASCLGADLRRDHYLQLALHRQPEAEAAILVRQAELQLAARQTDQAQTTLERLHKLMPHSQRTLKLLMQLYLLQQDWARLRELLPELSRHKVVEKANWQKLAVQVYREQLAAMSSGTDLDGLNAGWKQLPAAMRQDHVLLTVFTEQLLRLGAHDQAGRLLREQLGREWDQRLVGLFGEVRESDAGAQLEQGEQWLERYPDDAALLLAVAKIALRNQLWGKARGYLEGTIDRRPTPEACRLLGELLEQLDEPEKAARCYRKGLSLGSEAVSALPPGGEAADRLLSVSRSA
jgi:HemY protein